MLKFNPEQFMGTTPQQIANAEKAQDIFDAWLGEHPYVYSNISRQWSYGARIAEDTHRAYLVGVEEMKPCQHRAMQNVHYGTEGVQIRWKCASCGRSLMPKTWEAL